MTNTETIHNPTPGITSFKTTAVKKKDGWRYFGIDPEFPYMYGVNHEDIKEITLKISTDQEVPSLLKAKEEDDIWGFYEHKKEKFTLIYPQYISLYLCFPNGIKWVEEIGTGKAYRLEVVE